MIPGNSRILTCPHCGGIKKVLSLVSCNTIGALYWSDCKMEARMFPQVSPIQKCPHCGKYYMWYKQEAKFDEEGGFPSMEQGTLTYAQSHEALEQLLAEGINEDEEKCARVLLVHAYNDKFFRHKNDNIFRLRGVFTGFLSDIKIPDDMPVSSDEEIEPFEHKVKKLYYDLCSNKKTSIDTAPSSLGGKRSLIRRLVDFIKNKFSSNPDDHSTSSSENFHRPSEEEIQILKDKVLVLLSELYEKCKLHSKDEFEPSMMDLQIFKQNALRLIDLLTDEQELLFKAELYREIGDFESCENSLSEIKSPSEYEQKVIGKIREYCEASDIEVFCINQNNQLNHFQEQ